MSRLRHALHAGRVLLMDGAMGTELQRAGLREGACYERCNQTDPDQVRQIHAAYAAAGAECLVTNTFQANSPALARHGLSDQLESLCRAAVGLAREAAGPDRLVLGDIGPIAGNDLQADAVRLVSAFSEADGLLVETAS